MATKKEETYSYKGWLISDSFLKRTLAVIGYGIAGECFLFVILIVVAIIFMAIGAILGAF